MKYQVDSQSARGDQGSKEAAKAKETETAKKLEERLLSQTGDSNQNDLIRKHIVLRITDEGTVIELFDRADDRLFTELNASTGLLQSLLQKIVHVTKDMGNAVAIKGYVRSDPVVLTEKRPWDSSFHRIQIVRTILTKNEFDTSRIKRLEGHGDRAPVTRNPMALRNNRIQIVLLRE
jgi:chemotaxis protein MotB